MNGMLKRVILLLILVLAVVACASTPPVVDSALIGKWGIPDPTTGKALRPMLEFQADGTYIIGTMAYRFEARQKQGSYWNPSIPFMKTKFTYTITGSDMRIITGVVVSDVTKME
ncbi:MAG: hypothetical protein ABSF77_02570 [Spirochaetia bacterium]|jgi:hypothetical protein